MMKSIETFHDWTEEYSRYLDHLTTVDISYVATWKQRSKCENSLVLGVNDGPHPGPMTRRDKLASLQLSNVNKDE